jgi:hypothetical protein
MLRLSAYEPGSPSSQQLQGLHELVRTALPLARAWLVAQRPAAAFTTPMM